MELSLENMEKQRLQTSPLLNLLICETLADLSTFILKSTPIGHQNSK